VLQPAKADSIVSPAAAISGINNAPARFIVSSPFFRDGPLTGALQKPCQIRRVALAQRLQSR
jgi:hypothetical protein